MDRRRPTVTEEEVLHRLEAESRQQTERVRAMLHEEGRPDLVEDLDRQLRESRLGITGARATWDALSEPQRKVLLTLLEGNRRLVRQNHSQHWYDVIGEPEAVARVAGRPTIRNLIARELLAPDGGAFDPEAAAVLTERARFVVQHGHQNNNPG
ncbi:hypothetical protein F1643_21025 [Azospirillum sp. INR13]|uniref:hypothetical protein n=1 Tax=Azospirillum sp. INR13 TaxID=2596919 RepID=UPI001891F5A7|nr:hypothetical protein [Azospirillum sp. INR13]MBF5096483.1 hypothetical protein [Azospirillum sp. INR13]